MILGEETPTERQRLETLPDEDSMLTDYIEKFHSMNLSLADFGGAVVQRFHV